MIREFSMIDHFSMAGTFPTNPNGEASIQNDQKFRKTKNSDDNIFGPAWNNINIERNYYIP